MAESEVGFEEKIEQPEFFLNKKTQSCWISFNCATGTQTFQEYTEENTFAPIHKK